MSVEIIPLNSGVGAEVRNIDLSIDMSDAALADTMDAFARYRLLLFREQELPPERHIAFSRRLGELEHFVDSKDQLQGHPELLRVSNIDQEDDSIKDVEEPGHKSFTLGTSTWHSDSSYKEIPSKASLLYGIEIPAEGGETEFADTAAAYAALSDDEKAEIDDLTVIHDFEETRRWNGLPPRPLEVRLAVPAVEHPLVLQRENGDRCLFLGQHASYVLGKPYVESHAFLEKMVTYATQPQFVYHHAWSAGDLVLFDNLAMLHRAMPYRLAEDRRLLHRTTVAGVGAPSVAS
jgi:alpha-ketoglutarate-dependent taurine dioxygenase